jgi:predicted ATPase
MRFTRLELKNWKNFPKVEVDLANRVFLIGPNAIGKSNFLDAFRFLRDLAIDGGGLAKALSDEVRGGLGKVRSLYARQETDVTVLATVQDETGAGWRYEIAFNSMNGASSKPVLRKEVVHCIGADAKETEILRRPDSRDKGDPELLTQTAVQQVTANKDFRQMVDFFRDVAYLHIVPQLLREEQSPRSGGLGMDPFGRDLLDRIRNTTPKERKGRLGRIEKVLRVVTPQLKGLHLDVDAHGRPHLQSKFSHWRPQGAYQNETQFSDGTLRLIGLLWSLQEKAGPLLLEEPELSLHSAIVKKLAPFVARAQDQGNGRQVILSTHSETLLMDAGIAAEEVLLVQPAQEGAVVIQGATVPQIVRLMHAGIPAAEAAYACTETADMALFGTSTP